MEIASRITTITPTTSVMPVIAISGVRGLSPTSASFSSAFAVSIGCSMSSTTCFSLSTGSFTSRAYSRAMRVNVKGISGSGKTTFGRELAARLGVPYLELDAVHHIGPNWTEATAEELQASVREFIAGTPDGWVIDGN